MQFFSFIVVASLLALVWGQQQWVLDTNTQSSTLVGCGTGSATVAIAAAGQSGVGAVVDLYAGSGQNWDQDKGLVQASLLMDGAISADGSTSLLTSIFTILVSTDSSKTYTAVPGLGGALQDAQMFNNGQGMAGVGAIAVLPASGMAPGSVNGVVVSQDGAQTWSAIQVMDEKACRYGAFPSVDTWYVAAGTWNSTSVSVSAVDAPFHLEAQAPGFRLTKRVHVGSKTDMRVSRSAEAQRDGHRTHKRTGGAADSTTGWYGSIYKTTDGGATFSNVFNSNPDSTFYFNHISCGDENTCIVAAEGDNADGSPNGAVWATSDGGATWARTYFNASAQTMSAVKMTSATVGWFGVGIKDGRTPSTAFYLTADGGRTWTLQQTLAGCLAMDMDFSGDLGVATCISASGASMLLATYAAA